MFFPLQIGGIGIGVLVLLFVLWIGVAAIAGYLVYNHAAGNRDPNAKVWGIGIGFLFLLGVVPGLLGVIVYLLFQK